ncbi:MAG: hypothetical protein HFJ10_13420 [Lachnospiraceae bacterium]|nr:hypothetical protein [Lachnospiraceae bacterium]
MGSGSTIKATDIAAAMAATAVQGSRQAGKTDDGFQQLLNSKAQEDTNMKEPGDNKVDKKTDDTKESQDSKPANDSKEETKPDDNAVSTDEALNETQAALLLQQMNQTVHMAEETVMPEEIQLETVVAPVEEIVQPVLMEEPALKEETPAEDIPLLSAQETPVEEEPEAAAEKAEATPVKPVETSETKPVEREVPKQSVKEEPKQTARAEHEGNPEQQTVQTVQPETYRAEETPVQREIPIETVRVEQPEEIPEKITDQLLTKVMGDQREFEIQLEPYDLGKILIKVSMGKEATTISIICSEPKTMELMAKNAREIGAIMEEKLGDPTTILVEEKETGYLEKQNQQNDGNNAAEQEQERRQKQNEKNRENENLDFLQQLRLGLI